MPVHLTGRPVDMVRIQQVVDRHDQILEDAVQAAGSRFHGQRVGSWGRSIFSLHPLKSLHAFGDAGIVTAQDKQIVQDVALRKNHGLVDRGTCDSGTFNCRLDESRQRRLTNWPILTIGSVSDGALRTSTTHSWMEW